MQCALFLKLCLEVIDGVARGVEFGFLRRRVDFHQQIAFLDLITHLRMNLQDLPAGLRADVHVTARLQRTQRGHAVFDGTAGHRHGRGMALGVGQDLPGTHGNDREQAQRHQKGASRVSGAFHEESCVGGSAGRQATATIAAL